MRVRVALSSLLAIILLAVSCVSTTCAVACELTASPRVVQAEQTRSMPGMPGMFAPATTPTGHIASDDCCAHTCIQHHLVAALHDRAQDAISTPSAIVSTTLTMPVTLPLDRDCAPKPGTGFHTRPPSISTNLRV